jgi:hypothetical protein
MIARTRQRTRLYVGEPEPAAGFGQLIELRWCVIARDRQVSLRRAQVLTEGEDIDVASAEVPHAGEHLVPFLAHAKDDAGLGEGIGRQAAGVGEELEGPIVPAARPGQPVQALAGFEVVVEDIGCGIHHNAEGVLRTLEVRDENLDGRFGEPGADLEDASGKRLRAAVLEVVPVHRSDHHVAESHAGDGLGEPDRLVRVVRSGRSVRDGTVRAVPRAHVAQNHERGGLVLPALPDVGTASLLAHGVEPQLPHHSLELEVGRAAGCPDLQPRRLADQRGNRRPRRRDCASELDQRSRHSWVYSRTLRR